MDKIIDVHAHLGDILYPNGGQLIEEKNVSFGLGTSLGIFLEKLEAVESRVYGKIVRPLYNIEAIDNVIMQRLMKEKYHRNMMGTRENLRREMDKYGIVKVGLMPVYPNVTFDDLNAAAQKDDALIPFTGVDFDNLAGVEEKFARDIAAGARGLKLHPILQKTPFDSPEMMRVLEAFAPYDYPVLFHTGYADYYINPAEGHLQTPEYGDLEGFSKLLESFPQIKFIAGHAGQDDVWTMLQEMGHFKNLWVDVSFQAFPAIRELIRVLGADKVMYASDWPWGDMWASIRRTKVACRGDEGLARRVFHDNAAELLKLQ